VRANALSAGFQGVVHRCLPIPVGSRERLTRYRHFVGGGFGGEVPSGPDGRVVAGLEGALALVLQITRRISTS
jgi:hypothetical protein